MGRIISFLIYTTLWLSQCITSNPKKQTFNPTQYTLYFKSFDFILNDPNHWDWITTPDAISTKACTKQFTNLCIHINETKAGFILEYNHQQYNFLNDADFSQIEITYPINSINSIIPHVHTRRQLNEYTSNPGGLPFGVGGMGGLGDMERLGMMPGFGGSVGGMMPGVGQLGGMLNPNMGMMPSMGGGFGFGMGGSSGNPYPGYMMGYGNPMRHSRNMYKMFSRVLEGKPIWKRHKWRKGRYRAPRRRRRRRGRGRRGRRGRRGKRKRRRKKNYMHDGGQFGKMGFPSLSGNMMGLVQSSSGMPNFMKVPPTIHINAEFRRLLGVNGKGNNGDGVCLSKCVVVEKHEICAVYNLKDKSIMVRYNVGDMYVMKVLDMDDMDEVDEDINVNVNVNDYDYDLMELYMWNEWYGVWRNMVIFDADFIDEVDEDGGYEFKTVVWSDMDVERDCNDLLLSFINYTICVEEKDKDFVIYFKNTDTENENENDGDITKMVKLIYKESRLSISNDMDWNEIYRYEKTNIQRLCTFMPIIKLCATIDTDVMKISEISVQFVSIV